MKLWFIILFFVFLSLFELWNGIELIAIIESEYKQAEGILKDIYIRNSICFKIRYFLNIICLNYKYS